MEIHGNAFTVWGIWGAEYQSSVSDEHRPFRLRYLKDREGVLRPPRPTAYRRNKESGLRLISTEGQLGKKQICFLLKPQYIQIRFTFFIKLFKSQLGLIFLVAC